MTREHGQGLLRDLRILRLHEPGLTLARYLLDQGAVTPRVLEELLCELTRDGSTVADARRIGTRRLSPSEAGSVPERVGAYRIARLLSKGGMGLVYEAIHEPSGLARALKTVRSPSGKERAQELLRFRSEAEIIARLDHPNVVRIHEAELQGSFPYLIEDLLVGGSLHQRLQERGPLPPREAISIAVKLARAVDYAHSQGILHRDLKPKNVLFDERGEPFLVDFGLAQQLWEGADLRLTDEGEIIGTPAYMAPEQACGERVDCRADVYGLGSVLYAMLTGRPPYTGLPRDVLAQVVERGPPRPRALRPEVPPALEVVCLKAMARRPRQRYADAEELAQALESCRFGVRRLRRRELILSGVLANVALLALLIWASAKLPRRIPEPSLAAQPQAVQLQGTVPADLRWLEVSVDDGPPQRFWPGEELDLRLPAQSSTLRVRPVRSLADDPAPAWLSALPPEERPPWPLPRGIRTGLHPGEFVNLVDGSLLVWVPAGEYWQGSDEGQPDEQPVRRVELPQGVFLGRTEVTRAQYLKFCARTGRTAPELAPPDGGEQLPISGISWYDAQAYCEWAGLRLPTEEEWEAACRGPSGRRYPWGAYFSTSGAAVANLGQGNQRGPLPVGSFPAGASFCGALDLAGNVWEWVLDPGPPTAATGPRTRVCRGGGWHDAASEARGANRGFASPGSRRDDLGFRVCRSP